MGERLQIKVKATLIAAYLSVMKNFSSSFEAPAEGAALHSGIIRGRWPDADLLSSLVGKGRLEAYWKRIRS